jgi:hypothetical protein
MAGFQALRSRPSAMDGSKGGFPAVVSNDVANYCFPETRSNDHEPRAIIIGARFLVS